MPDDFGNEFASSRTLAERIAQLEYGLQENTKLTKAISEDTKEIIEAFAAIKGLLTVIEFAGRLVKPFAWIVALFGLVSAFTSSTKSSLSSHFHSWFR